MNYKIIGVGVLILGLFCISFTMPGNQIEYPDLNPGAEIEGVYDYLIVGGDYPAFSAGYKVKSVNKMLGK